MRGSHVMAFGGPSLPCAPDPSSIVPLREGRYKVQFTASQSLVDMFSEARDLFRNQLPTGDLPSILERALALLIAERKKQRFALPVPPLVLKQVLAPLPKRVAVWEWAVFGLRLAHRAAESALRSTSESRAST
ncbi:MAG TPA: hypothetical protein VFG30_38020 [Polyangiales bacterium]|nr:hypothetical protein [Polyangiales bacterium]